jgi:hypothetical protein
MYNLWGVNTPVNEEFLSPTRPYDAWGTREHKPNNKNRGQEENATCGLEKNNQQRDGSPEEVKTSTNKTN